mgnify:FL=1
MKRERIFRSYLHEPIDCAKKVVPECIKYIFPPFLIIEKNIVMLETGDAVRQYKMPLMSDLKLILCLRSRNDHRSEFRLFIQTSVWTRFG